MNNRNELADMSGETSYRSVRALELNEILLNGEEGYFRLRKWLERKSRDEKPEDHDLGKDVNVVFLKIRRRLVERGNNGEIVRSTNEHNSPTDVVKMYDKSTRESVVGTAADIRKRFDGLRTVQVVYALHLTGKTKPDVVRLVVKGASLGSEAKPDNVMSFYQYVGSFGQDEHIWEYKTNLTPIMEEGQRTYYAINFKRGEKLKEGSLEYAEEKLREIHEHCVTVDSARAARMERPAPASADETDDAGGSANSSGIEYPAEDIDPDDIPF